MKTSKKNQKNQDTKTRNLEERAPLATAESVDGVDAKLLPTEVVAFNKDVPAPASRPVPSAMMIASQLP